jgi:hypothetical protein
MAATVILIEDPQRWEAIREFLSECGEGALVFGPAAVRGLVERFGRETIDKLNGETIDYDYGGQSDIMLDWSDDVALSHYSTDAVVEHLRPRAGPVDLPKVIRHRK